MTWTRRMNLAIEYIEGNLDGVLNIEDVAQVASCSKYHFHRVFFACFKITYGEYVRKRKLTLAAQEILNSDKKILDIALAYGYNSPNAFTRAFRNMHGVNPSKARSDSVRLSSTKRVFFPIENTGKQLMHYEIEEIPEFNIIGKSKGFEFEKFAKEGPKFWKEYVTEKDYQKLIDLSDGRPGYITGAPLLTAFFPKESGRRDEFTDVLGIEATSDYDSTGFEVHTAPPATYAAFNCTYKSSMKTNRMIYAEWFTSAGYERDSSKPDIVAYFPVPFRPISEMRVRWWIPVVAKRQSSARRAGSPGEG